ncbi:MAG: hypothetical protein ACOYIQ_01935 [Christensenellales bacterium]|jgi:cell division ATPase FtsA
MSLNNCFAALYIGPDKLGLIKAQASQNGINIIKEQYQNYDGYDNAGFSEGSKFALSELLSKENLAECDRLIIGIPQEFCAHTAGEAHLRLPQAVQITKKQLNDLLADYAQTIVKDYHCIEKAALRYYEANGLAVEAPVGLITKELCADVSATYVKESVLNVLKNLCPDIPIIYTGIINALAKEFIPKSARAKDALIIAIGYAETTLACAQGEGIKHALHFSLGCADVICDLIKVLNIGYLHAAALFDVLDLAINPSSTDKYSINVKGDKFEYDIAKVNAIARARFEQIFDCCLEAMLKPGYDSQDVYLVCRGFARDRGLDEIAGGKLKKDIVFAMSAASFFTDRPEEEALIKYAGSFTPLPEKAKAAGSKFISLFRRKRVGK